MSAPVPDTAAGPGAPPAGFPLTACCRELYAAVLRARERAGAADGEPGERLAESVRTELLAVLRRQAESARRGEYGGASDLYPEVQLALAGLADEVFLRPGWPGAAAWRRRLLEFELFRTCRAGVEVFARIDRLLAAGGPAAADRARVYLLVLALGFEGAHRARPGEIDAYRRRLLAFLTGRPPGEEPPAGPLFPAAYATAERGDGQRGRPGLWLAACLLAALAWLLTAGLAWQRLTAGLAPLVRRLLGEAA